MTRRAKHPKRPRPGEAHSLRALAECVGRAHQVVARWVERPDWNLPRRPPWNIEKVKAWAAATLGPNPADLWQQREEGSVHADASGMEALRRNPLNAAKLKLTLTRTEFLALQKSILAGEFVPRREVEQALVARAQAVRAALQALPRQLAGELVGLADEAQIEQIIDGAIAGALLELSQHPALPDVRDMEVVK